MDFWEGWVSERDASFDKALEQRRAAGIRTPEAFDRWPLSTKLAWLRQNDREELLPPSNPEAVEDW